MNSGNKTLADKGELAFVEHIKTLMPADGGFFLRSAGDDCLITAPHGDNVTLATTDTFVETVHFTRDFFTFGQVGRRCMTASVSDIAAMAGTPSYSLVSLSMPKTMLFDEAVALFDGLRTAGEEYGCPVAGGETTSTPGPATITVTVIGTAEPGKAITRSGARPGDGIYVTGTVGDAMAGLEAFLKGEDGYRELKRKFIDPSALVSHARTLAGKYNLSSLIDVSDGIVTDLGHICGESGCGALLSAEKLPLSDEFGLFAGRFGIDPVAFSLRSGEEFELLFTSNDETMPERFTVEERQVTRIGVIEECEKSLRLTTGEGKTVALSSGGYEHFKTCTYHWPTGIWQVTSHHVAAEETIRESTDRKIQFYKGHNH